ncbi:MAG: TIGR03790 family protein [Acidobacteriia bacterium]|nr:TIGR03790 family protein [Terriglobia bacterium]
MRPIKLILPILLLAVAVQAQSPENVLLVLNESSPLSLEVGQYYAQKRGVPSQNILRIRTTLSDEISRDDFTLQIERPISAWLNRNSAQDRILYIVLTKGIPLRVAGTNGADGTVASVDSELTLLYRKLVGQQVPAAGRISNPYFLGDAPVGRASQFSHEAFDIFLVCRLDGYTSADIRALIDRGFAPSAEGKILLDQKGSPNDKGDSWLQVAADWLNANGFKDRAILDTGSNILREQNGVLGYYSWGSNDPAIRIRHFSLGFVPGALAAMFVSSDGRTFTEPPPDWQVGPWDDKSPKFAGSPQSLAGDLIRDGVTGVAAHVAEPYLEATIRPQILFPAYLSGFNLIESYYLAMPFLSWQTIIVGDPLCAPHRSRFLTGPQIDPGIDSGTELPRYFSERRLRFFSVPLFRQAAVLPDTVRLLLRAEVRMSKQDYAGAREALEDATARDSRLASAQLLLATIYDQDREYDKAFARYSKVVELAPDNPIALNNLAYALAVHRNSPQEALPLAEKAYSLAKGNPNIADTLGWICHLTGNDEKAGGLLQEAIQGAPQNAEVHLHMAVVSAALGKTERASVELALALELDPKLESLEDVKQLRLKLKKHEAASQKHPGHNRAHEDRFFDPWLFMNVWQR